MSKYGLTDENNSGRDFSAFTLEPGLYEMKLTKIQVKEFINTNPEYGEVGAPQQRLIFTYHEQGSDSYVNQFTSLSRHKKSKLFALMKSFNGGEVVDQEILASASATEKFLDAQLGKEFQIVVGRKLTGKGEEVNTVDAVIVPKTQSKAVAKPKAPVKEPTTTLDEDSIPF